MLSIFSSFCRVRDRQFYSKSSYSVTRVIALRTAVLALLSWSRQPENSSSAFNVEHKKFTTTPKAGGRSFPHFLFRELLGQQPCHSARLVSNMGQQQIRPFCRRDILTVSLLLHKRHRILQATEVVTGYLHILASRPPIRAFHYTRNYLPSYYTTYCSFIFASL
jgi:hypothetical protein